MALPFAILAPVPLEHLESGTSVASETGYTAYGSRNWELFREIDQKRDGEPVAMLIYPSYEDDPAVANARVAWFGWYVGHVEAKGGAHPSGMLHRPPTTAAHPKDNKGHWAIFWHIAGLRRLSAADAFPIGKLNTVKGGWRKDAPPIGPALVAMPSHFETAQYAPPTAS